MRVQTLELSIGTRTLTGFIMVLITVSASAACYEEDMTVSFDQKVPPTFRLSGSGNLAFFGVWEVAPKIRDGSPLKEWR